MSAERQPPNLNNIVEISPSPEGLELVAKFRDYLSQIPTLEKPLRKRPLLTVTTHIWEDQENGLTLKIFAQTVSALKKMAENANLDIDWLIILNNGGGKTVEMGQQFTAGSLNLLKDTFESQNVNYRDLEGVNQSDDPTIALGFELGFENLSRDTGFKVEVIRQPVSLANVGKIRAIRDSSTALFKHIQSGYQPDAILQLDVESILTLSKNVENTDFNPLSVLFNNLVRQKLDAVSTKDRFVHFNAETGEALNDPVPSPQLGYELVNTRGNFITLAGGAIMAKPAIYAAGMKAIAELFPCIVPEDYLFTQLLRQEKYALKSLAVVKHLNGAPKIKPAQQMQRWKAHAAAVDELFPGLKPYKTESFLNYTLLVIKNRLQEAWHGNSKALPALARDVRDLPNTVVIFRKDTANLKIGSATWQRNAM
jgi:hypothetical protein